MYMIRPRSVFAVALAIGSASSVFSVPINTTVVVDGARLDSVPKIQQSSASVSCLAHLHETSERPHAVLVTRRADSDMLSRDLSILTETKNRRSNKPSDRGLGHEQLHDSDRTNVRRADGGPLKPSRVTKSSPLGVKKKVTFLPNPVSQVKILEAPPQSSEAALAAKKLEEAKRASQKFNEELSALYDKIKQPMRPVSLGRPSGCRKPGGSPTRPLTQKNVKDMTSEGSPIEPLTPPKVKNMTSEEFHNTLFGYRKPSKDKRGPVRAAKIFVTP